MTAAVEETERDRFDRTVAGEEVVRKERSGVRAPTRDVETADAAS